MSNTTNTTNTNTSAAHEAASRGACISQDASASAMTPAQIAQTPMHESMRMPMRFGEEPSSPRVIFLQHSAMLPQAEHVAVRTWASARCVTLRGVGEAVALRMRDESIREAMDTPGATQFVGSVAFCMDGMTATHVRHPRLMDYPEAMESLGVMDEWPRIRLWGAVVQEMMGGDAASQDDAPIPGWPFQDEQGWIDLQRASGLHVKPWMTKFPRGRWAADTPVWVMPWVDFNAEFRVYMLRGRVAGVARYDDGDLERSDLEARAKEMAILLHGRWASYHDQDQGAPAGYAIDVGYRREKDTFRLVEINDGWALGMYKGMSPLTYVELLSARWQELAASPRPPVQ